MKVTNFEVYAFDRTRGWVLHARLGSQEREEAVNEGKRLEQQGFKVKVSREVYDNVDNTYEETDIYMSRPSPNEGMVGSAPSRGGGSSGAPYRPQPGASGGESFDFEAAGRQAVTILTSRAFPYLMIITILGILGGILAIRGLHLFIPWAWNNGFKIILRGDDLDKLDLASFVVGFILTAAPLLIIFMPRMFEQKSAGAGKRRSTPVQHVAVVPRTMTDSLETLTQKALKEEAAKAQAKAEADEEQASEPQASTQEEQRPSQTMADSDQSVEEPSSLSLDKTNDGVEPSEGVIEAASKLRTFIDNAVTAIKNTKVKLDSYNKFALNLYVAGAVDVIGDYKNLVASERSQLTANALSSLGTKGILANQFYDKLRDYTNEERYRKMVEIGREAMEDTLKGAGASAHGQLTGAIQEWSRGASANVGGGTMTVMFTDMVGSTDMTQDRGDVAAQEIVRRHNTIVRMALSQYGGREIKHTGDGIMASFDEASGAVDASISIQRNVSNHNKARPDQPLLLRIGLNAGRPIQEENDIFGATVQLAARVCAATQPEQILCTQSVQTLSPRRSDAISSIGSVPLKGFKEPIELFEVKW